MTISISADKGLGFFNVKWNTADCSPDGLKVYTATAGDLTLTVSLRTTSFRVKLTRGDSTFFDVGANPLEQNKSKAQNGPSAGNQFAVTIVWNGQDGVSSGLFLIHG